LLAFTTASGCTQNWATCHPTLSSVNRHQKNLSNCPKLLDHYIALSVRYGTRVLELAKGKVAVEVGAEKDLVPTLELIKTAVLNGELDTQIDAAALKLRDGFAQ
jgi:hypothetical protein